MERWQIKQMATGKNNPEKLENIVNTIKNIHSSNRIDELKKQTEMLRLDFETIQETLDKNELINARGIKPLLDNVIESSHKLSDYLEVLELIEKDLLEFEKNYDEFYDYYSNRYLSTISRTNL